MRINSIAPTVLIYYITTENNKKFGQRNDKSNTNVDDMLFLLHNYKECSRLRIKQPPPQLL